MTRCERNRKRRALRRAVLMLFTIVVPLAAVAASMFFMNIYNNGDSMDAEVKASPSDSSIAFKYNYEIAGKKLYRIELGAYKSFEDAEASLKAIKAKKLNGFIIKEDGYKVVYGVFINMDEASKVKESMGAKLDCSISEIKLPGYSLKYNNEENTFIQLVQAADQLVWDIAGAKSLISQEAALKIKKDPEVVLEEISEGELKLEKYLGYAEKISVHKELMTFREDFETMLKEVLDHRLGSEKDYFKIQDSLLNQVEAYRKFIVKLSI